MLSSISSISNENRKSAPKHERDKEEIRNYKMREPLWVNVWSRMYSDGFYLTKTEKLSEKIWANQLQEIRGFSANLELNLNRVIIHVGTNDFRYSQDPQAIPKSIIDIDKNAKNNKNDILMLSIISRLDNSIAKGRQVNEFLEKPYEKNKFTFETL